MPRNLKRYQQAGELHFITFSCYRRLAYLCTGKRGTVEVESQWTATRRELSTPMSQPQGSFDRLRTGYGAPASAVE